MDKEVKVQANALLGKLTHKYARFFPHLSLLFYILGGVWVGLCVQVFDSESLIMLLQIPAWTSIILLVFWFVRYRPIKKRIICLIQTDGVNGLERLVDEMKVSNNQKLPFLGERYLFYPKKALLLRYDEIVWMYNKQVTTKMDGIAMRTDTYLMLATSFGKTKPVTLTKEQARLISMKNPNLMVGYTEENDRKYQSILEQHRK